MHVGTTEDQGLYNKPSAAVHPGALAAVTLPQYTIQYSIDRMLLTGKTQIIRRKTCPSAALSRRPNFRYPKNYLVNSVTADGSYGMLV